MTARRGVSAWITAEQLSHENPALEDARRVVMIESRAALSRRPFHRRKLHLVLVAMRTFAGELRERGVKVDYRAAPSFRHGLEAHLRQHRPERIRVLAPTGDAAKAAYAALPFVEIVDRPHPAFLLAPGEFAEWAEGRSRLRMGDFYRHQRRTFGVLMEGGRPVGGRWSYDEANREPPPADRRPPPAWTPRETAIDAEVRDDLDDWGLETSGSDGPRTFPAARGEALSLLRRFADDRLPDFGRWQDAMLRGERSMWHSLLAAPLNLGLLKPMECIETAEFRHRAGTAPLASVEGFIRQILGWREFVRGLYEIERWRGRNALHARAPLPKAFWGGPTGMGCLSDAVSGVLRDGYAHHIERLMIFGNLMLLLGVRPDEAFEWFHAAFVDGHEWVMAPNVYGMALHADGGVMASKPYAATGRYVDRMSDHCAGCRYRPGDRTGERACPFTLLYWDFLDRKRARFEDHPRMLMMYRHLDGIPEEEMAAIRRRARSLRRRFDA